ncbi:hypothetical protein HPP92_004544 [Vanilla planifolia]|uniref:Uncharacterized protein n=1 Tax=Vanilla planifolia TaxID=51239 RepID=A0A835VK11_VANPL|nr:hypothetical protein HPP92_004544 [Vanilla planifolia]
MSSHLPYSLQLKTTRLPRQAVLVVVHPNLENPSLDPNLVAKLLHRSLLHLLQLPLHLLRKAQHLLLLLRSKLCPEPLLRHGSRRCGRFVGLRGLHGSEGKDHLVGRREKNSPLAHQLSSPSELEVPTRGRLAFHLLPVEVPVAAAGRAQEGLEGAFFSAGHKLAAAVGGVAADGGRVVFEAFSVLHLPAAGRSCSRERSGALKGHGEGFVAMALLPNIGACYWDWYLPFMARKIHSFISTSLPLLLYYSFLILITKLF